MKQLISELGTRNNSLVISTGSQQSDEICINLCCASKLISTREEEEEEGDSHLVKSEWSGMTSKPCSKSENNRKLSVI